MITKKEQLYGKYVHVPTDEDKKRVLAKATELGFRPLFVELMDTQVYIFFGKDDTLSHARFIAPSWTETPISIEDICGPKEITFQCKSVEISCDLNPPGSFAWAVDQMKAGKKVKRNSNPGMIHMEWSANGLFDDAAYSYNDVKATDWEIYEEPKKTLANKWIRGDFTTGEMFDGYKTRDVKEALKEFLEKYTDFELKNIEAEDTNLYRIAKEVFGEELLK